MKGDVTLWQKVAIILADEFEDIELTSLKKH